MISVICREVRNFAEEKKGKYSKQVEIETDSYQGGQVGEFSASIAVGGGGCECAFGGERSGEKQCDRFLSVA